MNPTAKILPGARPKSGSDAKKDGETGASSTPGRNAAPHRDNGTGGPGCAARSAARPAALPCLKSNNSTDRETDAAVHRLTGGHMRTAFALEENVKLLAENFGINRLGFLTLTFADLVTSIKEAQRRFNSLRTHVLSVRYPASIAVVERGAISGRLHFHLLVVCPEDIRTNFNFGECRRGNYRSANSWIRDEWAFWRRTARKFGFGRTELLPIKSTTEAIAAYVGKYITKHIHQRHEADKGARLVRYTKNARQVGTRFGWATGAGRVWRAKLARWAKAHRFADMEELKAAYGPRWAYHCMDSILATIPDLEMSAQEAESAGIPRALQEMADRLGKGGPITITHSMPEIIANDGGGKTMLKPAAVVMFGVRRARGRMEYRLFSRVRLGTFDSDQDFD